MLPNRKNITIHSENRIITAAHRRMFEPFLGDCCMKSDERKLHNLKVTKIYELFHDNHEKDPTSSFNYKLLKLMLLMTAYQKTQDISMMVYQKT